MKTFILTLFILFLLAEATAAAHSRMAASYTPESLTEGTEFSLVRPEIIHNRLAPATPREAVFEEVSFDRIPDIRELIPVAPATADFNDPDPDLSQQTGLLRPVTPAEADFAE